MLQKISKIENVGLFQSGTPKPVNLEKVAIFYGENGRGKTTLSAVLRSCMLGDSNVISLRKTIGATGNQEVHFLFNQAGKNLPVEFKGSSWSRPFPDIVIFDSTFVEENVYSGFEVRPEQRQSLLNFLLGNQIVALKNQLEQIAGLIDAENKKRTEAEKAISRLAYGFPLPQFIVLPNVPDIDKAIEDQKKSLEAAKKAQIILQRQIPTPLKMGSFDLQKFFSILETTVASIEEKAEKEVKAHFTKHNSQGFERWVGDGQGFVKSDSCPFCGQAISNSALIKAYKSFFNQDYNKLKAEVAGLEKMYQSSLPASLVEILSKSVDANTSLVNSWLENLELVPPEFDINEFDITLATTSMQLEELIQKKNSSPLEKIGSAPDREKIEAGLARLHLLIKTYNEALNPIIQAMTAFKTKVSGANPAAIQAEIKKLEATKVRFSPDTVKLVADFQAAEATKKTLEKQKASIRDQIDRSMETTLQANEARINQLLMKMGAGFSIGRVRATYQGGQPRTEYVIKLRQSEVALGNRAAGSPHFGSTLSEGDKRTLAFAFFISRLESDPAALVNAVVVFDDPVASLELHRRSHTIQAITDLIPKCAQIIVLSHDPFLVRDLRDRLSNLKSGSVNPSIHQVIRVQNDFSGFDVCDIDDLCASEYVRNYKIVSDFVAGVNSRKARDVVKSVRLMLEGFYHRRFPGLVPRRTVFGKFIQAVNSCDSSSPLFHLRPAIAELNEINDFVSQFHHDTDPGSEQSQINDSELVPIAKRALELIHKGSK